MTKFIPISKIKIMEITGLNIFPIKSIGGMALKETQVFAKGLAYDRRWMLVDENYKFISQRQHLEMTLIYCTWEGDHILIRHRTKDIAPIALSLKPDLDKPMQTVEIWGKHLEALVLEEKYSKWFEMAMGIKCQLVHLPEAWENRQTKTGEQVAFADSCPILIVGEASVADFNTRLDNPVSTANFRGNIIINTTSPYLEESWTNFNIGEVKFKGIKACGRCQVIGYDQEKATNDPAVLKTLAAYRKKNNRVPFGLLASIDTSAMESGMIKLGDQIKV